MSDIRTDYIAACDALKGLAQLIVASEAARYDMPPGMVVTRGEVGSNVADILNPTLDTVLDPRRMGLSDELRELTTFLKVFTQEATRRTSRLDAALARWEGEEAPAA